MVRKMQHLNRGRYAPSPTGDLHLGNLRTALLAWLFARCAGGQFVLRIEDLDRLRVRPGATERMLFDLRWLGLDWDEGPDIGGSYAPYTQSGTATLNGESTQRIFRGRPRGRLGMFGSGNGRLRGRPRRLGATQGGGATLYLNNSKTLQR